MRYLHTRQFPHRRYCWRCGRWVGTYRLVWEPRSIFGRRDGLRYWCKDDASLPNGGQA